MNKCVIISLFKKGAEKRMKALQVKSEITQCKTVEIKELLNKFIQYVDVSASSVRTYVFGVKAFIRYLSENGISAPTRNTILEYKKTLSATKSASTVSLYLSSLRRFFAWCENENLYGDITKGIKNPRIDTGHKKDAFSAQQLKKIMSGINRNSLKGSRDYAIFALTAATGLRTCEVIRADIGDIRTVQGEKVLFIQGKGRSSKSEFVKLSEHVMKAIEAYLKQRGEVSENEPLFASVSRRNFGGRMATRSISRICKGAMRAAGFDSKRFTAHSLRHSSITLALLAGISIQEVSQFARHSSISVTMIYAHDLERLKSRCESAISAALFE